MRLLYSIQKFVGDYGYKEQKGLLSFVLTIFASHITGYNHSKYWKRREKVVNPNYRTFFLKSYYLYYIKRTDAKHLSTFGTSWNQGAAFSAPPILPHGMNGIIVGYDAKIGTNVTFYQQVTIAKGGVVIGNNVILGAGCKILNGAHIGDNAKIGANCVVVEDVPAGATCVLNKPRIIIKENEQV